MLIHHTSSLELLVGKHRLVEILMNPQFILPLTGHILVVDFSSIEGRGLLLLGENPFEDRTSPVIVYGPKLAGKDFTYDISTENRRLKGTYTFTPSSFKDYVRLNMVVSFSAEGKGEEKMIKNSYFDPEHQMEYHLIPNLRKLENVISQERHGGHFEKVNGSTTEVVL